MPADLTARLSTGVEGMDDVLNGGLVPNRTYMFRGPAGSGKTILAFHFLQAGLASDETGLFINLEEDIDDLKANASSLGFDTDAIHFLDLSPRAEVFTEDQSYDVFSAAEVEQAPITERIIETVTELDPDRVVVDPATQLRYLTADEYQFRKHIVGFMRFLKSHGATVVFTVQDTEDMPSDELEFITDGTLSLTVGDDGRYVKVSKFRGSGMRSGEHTYRITGQGMQVFPAIEPGEPSEEFVLEPIPSGVPQIDDLLNGGLERGTVSIISGPTGVGKTTLGTQFMREAARRGERSVIYLFEENKRTFFTRCRGIGIPIDEMVEEGTLQVNVVEALERSPQEFAAMVREEVEDENARIVMVDGIAGYRLTLSGREGEMLKRLHALGRYLNSMGVTTILVDETRNITGEFSATQENISYLADNIVFLRHLELQGELRKAIGVLKKRTSDFEHTLREFSITDDGIVVGGRLREVRGVLQGTPELLSVDDEDDEEERDDD